MTEPLLVAEKLCARFGGLVAVHDVSLRIAGGELLCIIGPNGAGKSTLFNMLCGTLRPTAGYLHFAGREISGLPMHQFARIGIARKFQVPSVFQSMTVFDNLAVAIADQQEGENPERRIGEVLDLLALQDHSAVTAGHLAHGQKQWLEIGMALIGKPKLLLLDEPTAGMTREETQKTANLLRSLPQSLAIIAIEHDMNFVRALACRTMVMHQGRIVAEGPFSAIEGNTMVREIYLGRQ